MTRFFFDTEFYEDGHTIDLISIGMVCENGHYLYACNQEAELDRVSPWVRANVLPKLPRYGAIEWMTRADIRNLVTKFIAQHCGGVKPIFFAYYADYDWVVFCQLFGTMMDLPTTYPKFCRDLKQLSVDRGDPKHPPQTGEHNALEDARWNLKLYDFLMKLPVTDKGPQAGGSDVDFWKMMATRLVCGCFSLDCAEHGAFAPTDAERAERELPNVFKRRH